MAARIKRTARTAAVLGVATPQTVGLAGYKNRKPPRCGRSRPTRMALGAIAKP